MRASRLISGCCFVIGLVFAARLPADFPPKAPRWELTSYGVCLAIAPPDDPRWSAARQAALERALPLRIAANVGDDWHVAVSVCNADAGREARTFVDAEVAKPPSQLLSLLEAKEAEKLLVLTISPAAAGWRLAAREYDVDWRRTGPKVTRTIAFDASLASAAAALAVEAFCVQALVVEANGGGAGLKVRGSLPTERSPAFAVLSGRLETSRHREIFPIANAEATISQPQTPEAAADEAIDTGFRLTVVANENGLARCIVAAPDETELRTDGEPLRAVRIPRTLAPTILRVRHSAPTEEQESIGLAGFDVRISGEEAGESLFVGRTNSQGECELPAGIVGVRTVSIEHAGLPMTTFPLVVGEVALRDTPLAISSATLAAAEACQTLETALSDQASERAVLSARIRTALKANRLADARQLLSELKAQPTAEDFAARIAAARGQLTSVQTPADRRLSRRFERLSQEAAKRLDAAAIEALAKEVPAP